MDQRVPSRGSSGPERAESVLCSRAGRLRELTQMPALHGTKSCLVRNFNFGTGTAANVAGYVASDFHPRWGTCPRDRPTSCQLPVPCHFLFIFGL
ncbi:hypothetical protein GWI33_000190 [Rhynchophorus ferrugineus]|uniref:Uncharacterized protein n=1 Tax=Rhynchophorus ferrugineus TaxID=354439 RepID=A0A834IVM8_RHYFE|nr:hypothetical protein GWI33_000190 [Rhynchophorus ferrugineus]